MAGPSDTALFPQIAHPQKRAILAAYAECGRISHAATAAKVALRMHYYWRTVDPAYAAAWIEAQRMAGERLEELAVQRAEQGSDTLLIFLLKGAMPHKYRERYEHSGANGAPLEIVLTRRSGEGS